MAWARGRRDGRKDGEVDRGMSFTAKSTTGIAMSFPRIPTNLDLCNAILG